LFITTANWLDPVHGALRDRLEVINLPSYTATEKLIIAQRHLLPRQLDEHGLKKNQVRLPTATVRKLIASYTREAGVRQLEREIASLLRKAARRIVEGNGEVACMDVQPKMLPDLLGQPKYESEMAEKVREAGIAMGLAWTPVGGDILFIEVTRMPGTGKLTLTGSLGDVMKESAQTALSYLRSQSRRLGFDLRDYEKNDMHLHVPAGATPKDGPSAGVSIVTAMFSLLTHRIVRSDLAMTGEISLRGRVLKVGGIKEKVLAAARAGLREVILPEENRGDWSEVPEEIRKRMKVHFVRQINELFDIAINTK
jgi:ATP-dependent Lon protease